MPISSDAPAQAQTAALEHDHVFLGDNHRRNERKVWAVIVLTTAMMVIEIAAGTVFGSMALVADGWHMSTHAGAMLITALAYRYARRHAHDPRYTFGTGKLGDLAGFASAVVLALISLLIGWESLVRLANPVSIDFGQAIVVAVAGLVVNLVCAWLLKDDHAHHPHGSGHDHGHDDHHAHPAHEEDHPHAHGHAHGGDNNLRAAYLHVLADALTSILAIAALLLGRSFGWTWADPVMGVVGALVIARWSWGLIRDAGAVLLDAGRGGVAVQREILHVMAAEADHITDLHVWQVGPGRYAAILALAVQGDAEPAQYKSRLAHLPQLAHLTVEVQRVPA
ncbi:Cobalt-zinc-cadmium resistance protein CzcD [plant metagenome]|uniref:Cobalt-zinc-cadmium resistance protein CzcD n=1 Tax=plant metagenome TaxID=1297885 RepID=A0A484V1T9_9ZZZZ